MRSSGCGEDQGGYTTNMNFNSINPYLVSMAKDGLLDVMDGSPILYKTTPKGFEALEHIRALQDLIPGLSERETNK